MDMLDFICIGYPDLFGTRREWKIQNENICLQRDSNPRHATTDESAPLTTRPRRLDDDQWFNVLQDNEIQINKTIMRQHVSNWLWLHVYLNWMSY